MSASRSTARAIVEELVLFDDPASGLRVMAVLPVIPDAAPYAIREGIARRRISTLYGECPCGARRSDLTKVKRGEARRVEIVHGHGCPAADVRLVKAIRRWSR